MQTIYKEDFIDQGFFSMNLLDLFSAQKWKCCCVLTEGNESFLQIENLYFTVATQ